MVMNGKGSHRGVSRLYRVSVGISRCVSIRFAVPVFLYFGILTVLGAVVGCQSPKSTYPPIHDLNAERQLLRGRELVEGFAACGFCHSMEATPGQSLGGGRLFRDSYGLIRPGNITVDETGIGNWNVSSIRMVLREGKRPDRSRLAPHSHKGAEWMSDRDIDAITAFIRYLPAAKSSIPRREISFFNRNFRGFWETHGNVKGYVPETSRQHSVEYGKYLVDHVARCSACHNKPSGLFSSEAYLQGGKQIVIDGDFRFAPNITQSTSSGLGNWTEKEIKIFLTTGRTPKGRDVNARFCPVGFYAKAPRNDIEAVVSYLRTVKGDG